MRIGLQKCIIIITSEEKCPSFTIVIRIWEINLHGNLYKSFHIPRFCWILRWNVTWTCFHEIYPNMFESMKNFNCLVFGFGRSSLWPDLHWGKGWFIGGGVEGSCLQWGQCHHWILHWEIQERLWYLEQSQRKFSQPLLSQGIDLWVQTSSYSQIFCTTISVC